MTKPAARLSIGTSGYQYDHWRSVLYPVDLAKKEWLAYYADRFDAVEINSTFYSLPSVDTVRRWAEAVPETFRFVLKFSRYGSHIKRLKDPAQTIDRFRPLVDALGRRKGPVLLQLPPRWRANPDRLDAFLAAGRGIRWAVEFRDPDWLRDEIVDVLADHGAALCIHDALPDHPRPLTADWTYLRLHGPASGEGYDDATLEDWGRWLAEDVLDPGDDAWVFFNNDAGGHAVSDARRLAALLGETR
ncbi:MAG TPA: DUF72 domain-containing protein [Gammaproteobacteria bacterium]|nr:DUF72 domain-containing protein [Gammaproteobacteria bacterium]